MPTGGDFLGGSGPARQPDAPHQRPHSGHHGRSAPRARTLHSPAASGDSAAEASGKRSRPSQSQRPAGVEVARRLRDAGRGTARKDSEKCNLQSPSAAKLPGKWSQHRPVRRRTPRLAAETPGKCSPAWHGPGGVVGEKRSHASKVRPERCLTQEDVGAREIHPRPRGGLRAQDQEECANSMVVMATRRRTCAKEAGPCVA